MRTARAAILTAVLLAAMPPAALARHVSHATGSCAELSRAWGQKIGVARGTAADVALSRRLAGQAAQLCRSHDASRQAEGAQVYQRAILACDGSSKDPAMRQRY